MTEHTGQVRRVRKTANDPFTSLLATCGAFAAGYVSRPVGALTLDRRQKDTSP